MLCGGRRWQTATRCGKRNAFMALLPDGASVGCYGREPRALETPITMSGFWAAAASSMSDAETV